MVYLLVKPLHRTLRQVVRSNGRLTDIVCAAGAAIACYGLSVAFSVFAWSLPLERALVTGVLVPAATPLGIFIMMLLAAPVLALRHTFPSRSTRAARMLKQSVRSMDALAAYAMAQQLLGEGAFFQVTRGQADPPLADEFGAELQGLFADVAEIRIGPWLVARRDAIRWTEHPLASRLLELDAESEGPVIAVDEDEGTEVFDRTQLMKGIPWGTGWPTLSHYLVYRATACRIA
ncbi:MAG TPA: hypothetical protein P5572_17290 [Phycisphaerae bacterium]|nr:hypothetical protein [Phycisphaerae bacterium]